MTLLGLGLEVIVESSTVNDDGTEDLVLALQRRDTEEIYVSVPMKILDRPPSVAVRDSVVRDMGKVLLQQIHEVLGVGAAVLAKAERAKTSAEVPS